MSNRLQDSQKNHHMEEEIVITGISGRFPESDNIEEFEQQLFDGIDLVNDEPRRFPPGKFGLPHRMAKLKDISNFDAPFFGMSNKQADVMDIQLRLLLEATHEAIVDAGVNPAEVRGTNTGVFIGVSNSDTLEYWLQFPDKVDSYVLTGCSKAMFANRISYTFDFHGPSFSVDTACSSSLVALHQAYAAIEDGKCEAAIVGGSNLLLRPEVGLTIHRLQMLNEEGMCKTFDASGNGYARAEAIVVVYLQKARVARRVYGTLLGVNTNADGYKPEGVTFPSGLMQMEMTKEVYEKNRINPLDVTYVEAHGTGTKAGDPQEVNTIADFFCKNRKEPLLIGAVKSNMGHAEAASGLCSLAKMIIAMESGIIPGNLHFKSPNKNIPALCDGRLKVVAKNEEWKGGLMAMSSYGFGGANVHLAIRPNLKQKISHQTEGVQRMICVSGRTEDAVNRLLDGIEKHKNDEEFHALIESIYSGNITGHPVRGYTILNDKPLREVKQGGHSKRPVWFIYPGMGCQWPGMAKDLMKIDTFKNSIRKLANVLKPYSVNLEDIVLNEDHKNSTISPFVAIMGIQIALTDLLFSLGIKPDGIIGHSAGEAGCSYADGSLTAEEAIKAAYCRGKAIMEADTPPGAMAAVGLSWEETKKRCPPEVFAACHNCVDGVTISGNPEAVDSFVAELTSQNIFARKVDTNGYAYHCKFIAGAAVRFRKYLGELIPNPKPRSKKWISSSVPESEWNTQLGRYSSADYHAHNTLSPVLFYDATKHIPEDAIVIEIAPHGLFQSTLLRTLGPKATVLSLMKRRHEDNLEFLLTNLGKLYMAGAQPDISVLYPQVSFPVGRGTPMISSLIEWDHSIEWPVANFYQKTSRSGELVVDIDLSKEQYQFLAGHNIDNRIIFPATGYLILAWETLATLRNEDYKQMAVCFENVNLYRATIMPKQGSVKFLINIFEGSGEFEICEGGSVVSSGRIYVPEDVNKEELVLPKPIVPSKDGVLPLTESDIYTYFKLRGFGYSGLFRGVIESDNWGISGKLKWHDNWISFIDTLLQFSILSDRRRGLYLPTRLQKVLINPKKHAQLLSEEFQDKNIPVYRYSDIDIVKSGGVEMRSLKASLTSRRPQTQPSPKLEKYEIIPYDNKTPFTEDSSRQKDIALTVLLQTLLENIPGDRELIVIEIAQDQSAASALCPSIKKLFEEEPQVHVDAVFVTKGPIDDSTILEANEISHIQRDLTKEKLDKTAHLIILPEVLASSCAQLLSNVVQMLKAGGFVLIEKQRISDDKKLPLGELEIVSRQVTETKEYILMRQLIKEVESSVVIEVAGNNFSWLEPLKHAIKENNENCERIYVYAQGDIENGLVGMVNCLSLEPGGNNLRSFFIQDANAPRFSVAAYKDQIKKNLVHNILKNGVWGCYRHIVLDHSNESSKLQVEHAYVNTLHRGDLTSLSWIEGPLSLYTNDDPNVEMCSVYYAPLNFRDVMLATGRLPPDAIPGDLASQDCILGLEFSGRDSKGNRVMGMASAKSLATTITVDRRFLLEVPPEWSLKEASTVPVVYATSYYALIMRGNMQPGESVLIHAGSGGVGQSAISIALHMGCEVFTTVGSQAKRDFLKKMFPQLKDDNIGCSRDTSFEQMVLSRTNRRGVDLVLNSLADHQLQASVRCLAEGGRFLEIGKVDLANNSPLGMSILLKNTAVHGILLDSLFSSSTPCTRIFKLMNLIKEGISSGAVKPLPTVVFEEYKVEEAFRFMASGKHIGKVVVKIRDEENHKVQLYQSKLVTAIPRTYMHPNKSYIIIGGLGGFGLQLANWMILRGATKIVLNSRRGIRTGYQSFSVRRWNDMGVKVMISKEDASNEIGVKRLLQEANNLGPVGGIFNLAAVLKDAMLEKLSQKDFETVWKPKVDVTKQLDAASRTLAPQLDYFVTFSSLACGRGNLGQSNYGLANSVMERICEARHKEGLPGLSIQWGAIGDVGLIIELMGRDDVSLAGTSAQKISSCLATLDTFLKQSNPVVSSFVLAEIHKTENDKASLADDVANIMGIKDVSTVPSTATLADRGIDSLSGTQIKQVLELDYNIILSMQDIRNLTFGRLFELGGKALVATKIETTHAVDSKIESRFMKMTEIMPSKTLIQMQSKSQKGKTPVFVLHPIEGDVTVLETLAKSIEAPVYGLQCTAGIPIGSIQDLASYYIAQIKTVQPQGLYKLIGYSFGGCVAFEMGIQLEKDNNNKVDILFIDGTPSYVVAKTASYGKSGDLDRDQCAALIYFILQFKHINPEKVMSELLQLRNLRERVERTVEIISDVAPYPREKLAEATEYCYYKLVAADVYKPNSKFSGRASLIKATDNIVQMEGDHGLSDICSQKVMVYNIQGTHSSILEEPLVQKIVEVVHNVLLE